MKYFWINLMILGFFSSINYVFFTKPNWEKTLNELIPKDMVIIIDSNKSYSFAGTDYCASFLFKAKTKEMEQKIVNKLYAINYLYPDKDSSGKYSVENEFGPEYSDCFSYNSQWTFFQYKDVCYKVYIGKNGFFYLDYLET